MASQRQTVQDFIKTASPKDPLTGLTAFYEARLTAAASAADLRQVAQDIQSYQTENEYLARRRNVMLHVGAVAMALTLGAGGAVGLAAYTATLMPGAEAVIYVVVGLGAFVVGKTVADSSRLFFANADETQTRAAAESAVLTALTAKAQEKLAALGENLQMTPAVAAPSFMTKLKSIFSFAAKKPAKAPESPKKSPVPAPGADK